jgi:hypothetical protein
VFGGKYSPRIAVHENEESLRAIFAVPVGYFGNQKDVFGAFGEHDGVGATSGRGNFKCSSFFAEAAEVPCAGFEQ